LSTTEAFSVRVVAADQISDRDIGAWAALEARALEPNAYLSPHFMLPQIRHLAGTQRPAVLFVERTVLHARELVGVAVVGDVAPSLAFPVRRLVGYGTSYAALGGILLDRECALDALRALLEHARALPEHFGALELPLIWSDGPLPALVQSATRESGFEVQIARRVPRAVMVPSRAADVLQSPVLAGRLRDVARRQRRLQERGEVGWRLLGESSLPAHAVDALLALEHMGWKGEGGSSLRSDAVREAFFREVVAGFAAERRTLFSELTLDGVAIASTCNFLSGRMGFAFKIGWNSELRAYSPSWLNEVEFMRQAAARLGGIELMDSGASEDSYINELWLERRTLATLVIPLSFAGRLASGGLASARVVKRHVFGAATRMFATASRSRRARAPAR
jgi:CelD/BcsL family acetyltransferase involved in cellulose biosynthesis